MTTDLQIPWPLPPGEAAAIAVSGGADSFALLHWAWKAGHPIVALTVDHQLREGSAEEAQAVRTFCSERNIAHETLIWRGEKPSTGIQAAAREARYRLLCQACERMGIEHLLTAHTADDQAETVFMRLRRGAGRGLAGMPSERKIAAGPGALITLHRPMLGLRREAARAYAEAQGVPFVDDPSNDDEKYERVRVRALLAALEQQGLLTVEALCGTSARAAAIQEAISSGFEHSTGDISYLLGRQSDDQGVFPADRDGIPKFLFDAELVPEHGGAIEDWDYELVRAFASAIGDDCTDRPIPELQPCSRTTFAGVVIDWRDAEEDYWAPIVILREPAALLGRADGTPGFTPVPAPSGSKHLYDRRFIVTVPVQARASLDLRPLGQLMPRDIATSTRARQRIATLPCLAEGDLLRYLPEQAQDAVTQALAGWKQGDAFLSHLEGTFQARSLLSERFVGDVIRY
ncbi:tRNA lysidine(34) synthetase TilS [Parvularcula sp. ZS-1/3]|uniref:tRNA(Ile)-lysidine synthase n=1 Tax=Parvularcula mediterranea TaxID=2732508 RepID=A0A7Y3RNH7_9PROT|nr:tRNA lysidine(34) synthetase TilS [Parvularcula mediterranea]NNU17339.1 tRNA lysidine(34) synthetase TilS [Parvularcula mediterranea]